MNPSATSLGDARSDPLSSENPTPHSGDDPRGPLERARERALWRRLREGSREAIGQFYDDRVEGLYVFVFYRCGRQAELAEEIVADTFRDALEQIDQYDPERGSLQTWLSLRARNVIRRHLRSQRRAAEQQAMWDRIDADLATALHDLEEKPLSDEILVQRETHDLVHAAIAHLPEHYQRVLSARYLDGQTTAELASSCALSVSATKSLLARARRAFKAAFETLTTALSAPSEGGTSS